MDRLSALTLVVLTLGACDGESNAPPPAADRVQAVMANKRSSFADLCDIAPQAGEKPFPWPELAEAPPAPGGARYRWVNAWATWCKPCVEELPLLTRTFEAWKKQGNDVTLTLVSVDQDAAAAKSFIAARPGTPASLQLKDATQATAWLSQIGLSGGTVPAHAVVDAKGSLLCARSGGVTETHLERFKQVLFP
ncbi:MAG TPA: redoxin family protein [Polyangiales bacterium]|nr:redoxin family protein [Polyangiales bacterium]